MLEDKPTGSRRVIWCSFLVLVVFFSWAYFAKIDEIARAPGTVIASSRVQLIQSQDGGVLEALLVKEGQAVSAGQDIALIDSTRARAAYLEVKSNVASLTAKVARLNAEVLGNKIDFPHWLQQYPTTRENQVTLLARREQALTAEINALEEVRSLLKQELVMNQPLLKAGDVSKTELLRLERQVAELNAEITNKKNAWLQDVQAQLSDTETELGGLEQQLIQRKSMLDKTILRSPLKGIVKDIKITTIGGVIKPGEDIIQVVPVEDNLLIEAKLNPSDIAFLHDGLDVSVKIDAYDYTVYGDLSGKLVFISADTLKENLRDSEQPYYRVRVRTDGKRFSARPDQELEIQAGMTATVEIKTGQRTVMSYLTKPIVKTLSESLGER